MSQRGVWRANRRTPPWANLASPGHREESASHQMWLCFYAWISTSSGPSEKKEMALGQNQDHICVCDSWNSYWNPPTRSRARAWQRPKKSTDLLGTVWRPSTLRRYYSPSLAIQGLGQRVINGLPCQQCASAQRSGLQRTHLRSPDGLWWSKSSNSHFVWSFIPCLNRAVLHAKCIELHDTWRKFESYVYL